MEKFLITPKRKPSTSRQGENECVSTNPAPPSPKRQKTQQHREFTDKWLMMNEFKNWLSKKEQESGPDIAYCKVCDCTITNHKPAIVKHMQTVKHVHNMKSKSNTTPIEALLKPKKEDELVKRAELKISAFIAQHNLPFSLADDLIPFLENTFPDSAIIKSLNLARTKATNTIKSVLGPIITQELVEKLKRTPFSLIMDETTDISVTKQCALTVIYCDDDGSIRTQFVTMYTPDSGKAEDLTNGLINWLVDRKVPLDNFVGFASDTTNSMVGQHNSVFSHLKQKVPHIACVKCSCHMIHLVASKACLKLPRSVEDLLRSVGAHFNRSSSRQSKLREFQQFFKVEIHKILSPSITRWLSLEACVNRTLEQYEVLQEYFKMEVFEDPSNITETILSTMNNKFTKMYLEFMSYVLNLFNDFNRLFQSQRPLLHQVKPEVYKLIKTIASNYMSLNYCKTTDAFILEYNNPRFFTPLEKIYLGVLTQESIIELEKEEPPPKTQINEFRKSCLAFYIEAIKQITQRFDFSDPLYEIVEQITDPHKAQTYDTKDLSNAINRFPNIKKAVNLEELNKEWKNHALLEFSSLNLSPDLEADVYWSRIFKMKNYAGEVLFPNLKIVINLLLILPFSNASVERIFSQLKLIKCDNRNRLGTETISALMATKGAIKSATAFEPPSVMLKTKITYCKKNEGE